MIVVFGSINVDGVLTTSRLPQLGETVVGAEYATYPGGKGANQAVAAARYGAEVAMVGCVGEDPNAEISLRSLQGAGVDTSRVARGRRPTAYASVWVDSTGQNQIIVASGANFEARAAQLAPAWLQPSNYLLLQLEVDPRQNEAAVARAAAAGMKIVLNAAPFQSISGDVLAALDVLIVNEIEAQGLARALGEPAAAETDAARRLAARFELCCVVTLGAAGAVAFAGGDSWTVPTLAIDPIDTTGAGDTFVGCFTAALDQGAGVPEALRIGTAAGALACTKLGAQSGMPSRNEVDGACVRLPGGSK